MTIKALNVYRTFYPDPPGGLQEAIKQICLSTSKYGVENTVFTLTNNNFPKVVHRNEATVLRGKSWGAPASCDIGGIGSVLDFKRAVNHTDIIQYHFPWPFADVLHWLTRPKKPAIITYHSDIVRQRKMGNLYTPLMLKFLQRMDAVIATSPAYTQTSSVLTHQSIRDRVQVIPLGIDESQYNDNEDKSVFKRLGFDLHEPYFLFLGVHRYYKGLEYLIHAAKGLKAKIVIAGSGPEKEKLKNIAFESGAKNVYFANYVTHTEKVALIKNCLAFVLPSHLRSEAFGMVLVEAAMMSKPLISCELGTGTSYVNIDQETGFVVPPSNPDKLRDAMQTFLENEQLAVKMGREARKRYQKHFSGEAMGSAYLKLYQKLV